MTRCLSRTPTYWNLGVTGSCVWQAKLGQSTTQPLRNFYELPSALASKKPARKGEGHIGSIRRSGAGLISQFMRELNVQRPCRSASNAEGFRATR